jgi:hypothetical protein
LNGFSSLEKIAQEFTTPSGLLACHPFTEGEFNSEFNSTLLEGCLKGGVFVDTHKLSQQLENIEIIIVLRILNNLGYIGNDKMLEGLVKSPIEEIIFEIPQTMSLTSQIKNKIFFQINKILKETHL